ncbi:unnamed protein product [Lupinus luteus]|uniref:NAD-dependent epimerase/dehydratase domain-containing protein n=1 Tax=Lupinus luteus TaxID=3873 RepID=A0AAV1XSW9_LUPLU
MPTSKIGDELPARRNMYIKVNLYLDDKANYNLHDQRVWFHRFSPMRETHERAPHKVLALDVYNDKIKHLLEPDNLPWQGRIHFYRLNIKHDSRLEGLIKMSDLTINLTAICTPADYNIRPLDTIYSNFIDALPVIKANGHIFNVGNPNNEVTVRQLAEMMIQVTMGNPNNGFTYMPFFQPNIEDVFYPCGGILASLYLLALQGQLKCDVSRGYPQDGYHKTRSHP